MCLKLKIYPYLRLSARGVNGLILELLRTKHQYYLIVSLKSAFLNAGAVVLGDNQIAKKR
jgi:hypothetical protein